MEINTGRDRCTATHKRSSLDHEGRSPQGTQRQACRDNKLLHRERDCFYYLIVQTYDVGLHSGDTPLTSLGRRRWIERSSQQR